MPLFDELLLLLQRRQRRQPNVMCVNADDAAANITQVGSNGSTNDSFGTFRATACTHWSLLLEDMMILIVLSLMLLLPDTACCSAIFMIFLILFLIFLS